MAGTRTENQYLSVVKLSYLTEGADNKWKTIFKFIYNIKQTVDVDYGFQLFEI